MAAAARCPLAESEDGLFCSVTWQIGRGCGDFPEVDLLPHVVPTSFVGRRKHMNWKNADITFPVTWGVAPVLLLVRQFAS